MRTLEQLGRDIEDARQHINLFKASNPDASISITLEGWPLPVMKEFAEMTGERISEPHGSTKGSFYMFALFEDRTYIKVQSVVYERTEPEWLPVKQEA